MVTVAEIMKRRIEKYRKLNRITDGRLSRCSSSQGIAV
jgi:hypothetical protein